MVKTSVSLNYVSLLRCNQASALSSQAVNATNLCKAYATVAERT